MPELPADAWSVAQRQVLESTDELQITTRRADSTLRAWVPIWVVVVDEQAYVRTWHRRSTGWFGHAVTDRRARVRASGVESEVDVDDVGADALGLRLAIDRAFTTKYLARHGRPSITGMTTDAAAAATLRLRRPTATTPVAGHDGPRPGPASGEVARAARRRLSADRGAT